MGMIVPIKRGTAQVLYAAEDGVCLKEIKSGAYMISVSSYETGIRLMNLLPEEGLFSFHQTFMLDSFKDRVRFSTLMENYQAVYFSTDFLPVDCNIAIQPLTISDYEVVMQNYEVDVGTDYIMKRLEEGELFGCYINTVLTGFIGTHAEGSIGLLKVFNQHRRNGYGSALTAFMVNRQLSQGVVPFEQIDINNNSSLKLARKLGFTLSTDHVYWVF